MTRDARQVGLDAQKSLAQPNSVFIEILEASVAKDSAELVSLQGQIDAEICACKTWVLVYDEQKQDEAAENNAEPVGNYQAPVKPLPGQVGSLRQSRQSASKQADALKYRNVIAEDPSKAAPSLKEARKTFKEGRNAGKGKSGGSTDLSKAEQVEMVEKQLALLGMF